MLYTILCCFFSILATLSAQEPIFFIAEAPQSMIDLWENAEEHFSHKEYVKPHDDQKFSKFRQLSKLWSKGKNESGHYERKESIVVTSDESGPEFMLPCRRDLRAFCIDHLRKIEQMYGMQKYSLSMEIANKPTHTMRLLHYLPKSSATAHCDTSIMTCLYYQSKGLELKVDGKWIEAPELKHNEMLVSYGVPGEILSNGVLKAVRHRVKCNERYAVAYFHNTPKDYVLQSENYGPTTMAQVYQEAQLWYADVNARAVRKLCKTTDLTKTAVIYGWLAQRWMPQNENPISWKGQDGKRNGRPSKIAQIVH